MEADIALTNITPERTSTAAGTPQVTSQNAEHPARPGFSLAQADGGKDAWFFLAACFAVEALVWGRPRSFMNLSSVHNKAQRNGLKALRSPTCINLYIFLSCDMLQVSDVPC